MVKSNIGFKSALGVNAFVATLLTLVTVGCSRNSAPDNPLAMAVGEKVVRKHDKNGDGLLTSSELSGLYGNLTSIREGWDLNGDEKLSRDEIASRIDAWQKRGPTGHIVNVTVILDRSPLAGATVRMVPDFDPGDGSQAKVAETDVTGVAHFEVVLEDLPQAYTIRITAAYLDRTTKSKSPTLSTRFPPNTTSAPDSVRTCRATHLAAKSAWNCDAGRG